MSASSQADGIMDAVAHPKHAGLKVRLLAGLLDIAIMGIPVFLLISIILPSDTSEIFGRDIEVTNAKGEAVSNRLSVSVTDLLQIVVVATITILLWKNWDGRTPGKKLTGTRVVCYPEYGALTYSASAVRMMASVASALPLFLGYVAISLMVGLREDKRGYHDLLARTCVVHDR